MLNDGTAYLDVIRPQGYYTFVPDTLWDGTKVSNIKPQAFQPIPHGEYNSAYYFDVLEIEHAFSVFEPFDNVLEKKANPVKVTAKAKTVKAKKLKKKAQKAATFKVTNAQGKVSFKITSAKKNIKKFLTISKKGVLKIKKWKKPKKGTYKIKIKITAKGNDAYKAKTVTKTVKIKIK